MIRLNRGTWIIAISILAVAGIFAAAGAYGSQASQASFDSNLPAFMQRSDSTLLKITRHQNTGAESQHLDEYSLGISDAALYKYISAVDKAHNSRLAEKAELQQAYIEVVLSKSETRTMMKEIDFELKAEQVDPDFEVHMQEIELSGRYYTIELMIPRQN